MIGQTLGHYRIEEQLGTGGMGVVYRARDTKLERDVALKLLSDSTSARDARGRLLDEARAASALNHPNVATIYEIGEAEGRRYIAMEYVAGRALSAQIPAEGLPVDMVIRYGAQIASALAHAHERGVVHRDLKSANVVITPEGHAKVLDFGLAARFSKGELDQATRSLDSAGWSGAIAGTLHYMAPEVLQGEPGDARSDIWALGIVLYEMAAGRLPFQGRTGFELTSGILREPLPPPPAAVPATLRGVMQRCLAKEPGQRYQRAGEVRAALEAIRSDAASVELPVRTAAEPAVPRRPWWRRRPKTVLAVLIFVVFLGLSLWKGPFMLSIGKTNLEPAGPRTSTGAPASANAEANEYFEKGLQFITVQLDLARSRKMFERAIQLDPRFTEARAWYAYSHTVLIDSGESNDPAWLYKGEEEIRPVLERNPNSGRAHVVLGVIHFYRGRPDQAEAEFKKALEINPRDFDAIGWRAENSLLSGDYEAVKSDVSKMLALNPLYFFARWCLGETLRETGDTAGAIREFEKLLEQDPHNLYALGSFVRSHLQKGDLSAARAAFERFGHDRRDNFLVRLVGAVLLAAEGRRESARREMSPEVLKYAQVAPYSTALAVEYYALMGEPEKALDWLDRAVQNGDERMEWYRRDRLLTSIQNHPRFKQILDSIAFRRQQRNR